MNTPDIHGEKMKQLSELLKEIFGVEGLNIIINTNNVPLALLQEGFKGPIILAVQHPMTTAEWNAQHGRAKK